MWLYCRNNPYLHKKVGRFLVIWLSLCRETWGWTLLYRIFVVVAKPIWHKEFCLQLAKANRQRQVLRGCASKMLSSLCLYLHACLHSVLCPPCLPWGWYSREVHKLLRRGMDEECLSLGSFVVQNWIHFHTLNFKLDSWYFIYKLNHKWHCKITSWGWAVSSSGPAEAC